MTAHALILQMRQIGFPSATMLTAQAQLKPQSRSIQNLMAAIGVFAAATRGKKEASMAQKRKTFDVGRDSKSGQFITVKEAKKRPNTTTVERVPKPGRGDTKGEPRRK